MRFSLMSIFRQGLVDRPSSFDTLGATTNLRSVPGLSSSAGNTVGQANRGTRHFRSVGPLGRAGLVFLALLLMSPGGCVQRRMMIRSNPPGALVYVDDYEIGTTPISTDFTYYGTRKIRLVKGGYETLTVMQSVPVPWHQYPPLDFITENCIPGEIRDQRVFDYQLTPQMVVPTNQLIARAEGLRRSNPRAANVPPGAAAAVPATQPYFSPPPNTLPPGGGTPSYSPPAGAPETVPPPAPVQPGAPGGASPPAGTVPLLPVPSTPSGVGGYEVPTLPPR